MNKYFYDTSSQNYFIQDYNGYKTEYDADLPFKRPIPFGIPRKGSFSVMAVVDRVSHDPQNL